MRHLLPLLLVTLALPARAATVDVPVDVGVGPAALLISGPVFDDQAVHTGLKISVQAIIDRALIQRERNRIPARYRNIVEHSEEIRITPFILIPDELIISPKYKNTGIYGLTWRPLAAGIPLIRGGGVNFGLDAGLVLTTFYLYSDTLPNTFFLRPGIDLKAELEIMFTDSFGISLGWDSGFYLPERLGSFTGIDFSSDTFDHDIWHIGQGFLKLHFRFPYAATL